MEVQTFNADLEEMDRLMSQALESKHPYEMRGAVDGYGSSFFGYKYRVGSDNQLVLDFHAFWKDEPSYPVYNSAILTFAHNTWEVVGSEKRIFSVDDDPTEVFVAITDAMMSPAERRPIELNGLGLILTLPEINII